MKISKISLQNLFLLLGCFFISANISAQTDEIIRDYVSLGESETRVDVSAAVVKCGERNNAKVFLDVRNDLSESQAVGFDITITDDESGESVVRRVGEVNLGGSQKLAAHCGDEATDGLKLDIPSHYDAINVTIEVDFVREE